MIKRFAQCLREYKWTALVSPVCMIGEVAMEVTIPLVMADLYDYGIAVGNMTVVWQKALQLLICSNASIFRLSTPTAIGLTCLSSPTMISFLPIYRIAREEISDWLASSMITISNLFSLGFRLSSALLIGMIQAGTAAWH